MLDIDSQILFLDAEAEKQHQLINEWQSKNNKLYCYKTSAFSKLYHKNDLDSTSKCIFGFKVLKSIILLFSCPTLMCIVSDLHFLVILIIIGIQDNINQANSILNNIEMDRQRLVASRNDVVEKLAKMKQRAEELENVIFFSMIFFRYQIQNSLKGNTISFFLE